MTAGTTGIEWTDTLSEAAVVIRKRARQMHHTGGSAKYPCGSIARCDRCKTERLADKLDRIADDLRVREMPTVRT